MDTSKLKNFAKEARRTLLEQVSSKLSLVLQSESSARREAPQAVYQLEQALKTQGKDTLIDKVAYTWFNRFCALRFMDVNGYNRVGVVSPVAGQVQPEILSEAKAGHLDDSLVNARAAERVLGLLNGSIKSQDGQTEAYRNLIVAVCNSYHSLMPYLFQHIDDYTELLMPDDLLSENSILAKTREAMTPEACTSVEVIGWLYQFYISEKKDKVFADLKNNKKVTAENIPAATQLFTPHWIVRYLVENSLGRLWLLNNPNSRIVEKMDYYIKPAPAAEGEEQPETDFLKISSPEELKICDPAAGSGHMLTYAYDLLYAIYLDAGYDPVDIPELILTKNLYGIEIDERASELAAFALSMKAIKGNPDDDGNNRRRFFRNPIRPNICKLDKIIFTEDELDEYFEFVGKDLFTADLRKALKDFEEADNFGSLITPTIGDVTEVLRTLEAKDVSGQLFLTDTHHKVLKVLWQADYLSQKYNVVVANPPYMGGKGMNARIAAWLNQNYTEVKSDLFSAFIVRNAKLTTVGGQLGFMTPFVWMFISSYEKLREFLIDEKTITSLIQLEYSGFDGATVPICAFTIENKFEAKYRGGYIRLSDFKGSENQSPKTLEAIKNPDCGWFYRSNAHTFKKLPSSIIGYWFTKQATKAFIDGTDLAAVSKPLVGLQTSDNARFLRLWYEVPLDNSYFTAKNNIEAKKSGKKWFPHVKGGGYRRWFGFNEYLINWLNDGLELKESIKTRLKSNTFTKEIRNEEKYFLPNISWGAITSNKPSFRMSEAGTIFNIGGPAIFPNEEKYLLCSFLNSKIAEFYISSICMTLNLTPGDVGRLPILKDYIKNSDPNIAKACINISKNDWDYYELSWDFRVSPFLKQGCCAQKIEDVYTEQRLFWKEMTAEMLMLEEKNNRFFIDAYGLRDELTPEVPIEEITLTCNPAYRYGTKISEEERETRLRADTMAEFISYAVGCMFGRYSLDEPGLILANQGDRLEDYLARIQTPTFMPDDDNVIPLIDFDGDWFEDDITERFKKFLKVTFGEANFAENLAFIEDALGKDIRKYLLKDFYKDHVQRYKKRPIYWQFSSSKGTFNALIYMHRYRPDTCSLVLDYLRDFRVKLEARKQSFEHINISASATQKDKTQALKMIDKINKALDEVNDYEREVLFPLAAERISIDLDDGVKRNYPLFGSALKKIAGLEGDDND
ncbi:BREX-1 system adenine-specific DNA-methyltransferase PglX [Shewanella sp. 8A]|uniref:BREX-1 system adenine-specific DNA-methyltransferase PglX n=1 Tax=Shewanella sp. 8A TaxID=2943323 RepID=UPI00201A58E5|nr:BREX-1 system adenine-specific DNA-methyltransferase PglX [Shewanella sp. 8A]